MEEKKKIDNKLLYSSINTFVAADAVAVVVVVVVVWSILS
jgi:hypothetical protein